MRQVHLSEFFRAGLAAIGTFGLGRKHPDVEVDQPDNANVVLRHNSVTLKNLRMHRDALLAAI
jgi:hypothetical protein